MNLLFTVCARAGSKGVKSKNMRDFLGYPILYTTLSAYDLYVKKYLAEGDSATLVINTDAPQLIEQANGTCVPFIHIPRKESLAGDRAPKISVIADTLDAAEKVTGKHFDMVIDMDLTSPLRKPSDIAGIIAALAGNCQAQVAMSVTEARRNPYFNQLTVDPDGFMHTAIASSFVARQEAPTVVDANASLYSYRPDYLRNNDGILLHGKVIPWEMEDTAVLDIDSERDFMLLGVLAEWFFANSEPFAEVRNNIPNILRR